MEINYNFKNYSKKLTGINLHIQKLKTTLLHHLLLVASSLLGILVSLHGNNDASILLRWVFATISVLLSLSILTAAISLYAELHYVQRAKERYVSSSIEAVRDGRAAEPVFVKPLKIFSICQTAAYVCFAASIVALAWYAVLLSFSF